MMAPANGLGCEATSFDVLPPSTYCGVLIAKRDEVSHAAVCVVTCPFYGCYHRSQMAAHQVDAPASTR